MIEAGFIPNFKFRMCLFETWHCVNSGTEKGCAYDKNDDVPWRERLDQDLEKWRGIAKAAGPEVKLVPGGQALAPGTDRLRLNPRE